MIFTIKDMNCLIELIEGFKLMLDKIYTIIGCILIVVLFPVIILVGFWIFWMKCIGRSMFIYNCILTPYIKYKVITNDNEAWNKSVIDRIYSKKYYE